MKKYETFITNFIIVFLFISFILSIFVTFNIADLKYFSFILSVFGVIGFILLLFCYIKGYNKPDICEILIILLIIFGIISVIFAIDINDALFGKIDRREGFFSIISYYFFFLLCRNINNEKNIKKIINIFLLLNFLMIIYGIFQAIPYLKNIFIISSMYNYASSFLGNPNFYGSYILMGTCLVTILYIYNKKNIFIVAFFIFGLLLSGSLACILAFTYIYIFFCIILLYRKQIKKYIIKILAIILIFTFNFILVNNITQNQILNDSKEATNQFTSSINNGIKNEYGNNRIYIWKKTIEILPNNIINGVGIDNFENAFNPPLRTITDNLIVDKAHNEYLQKLITEGIFSFLTYLILLLYVFLNGLKKNKNITYMSIFILFIGYCIQAFFNISVIRVAPIFFIFSGILCNKLYIKETSDIIDTDD